MRCGRLTVAGGLMQSVLILLLMMLRTGVGSPSIILIPNGQNSDQRSRITITTLEQQQQSIIMLI